MAENPMTYPRNNKSHDSLKTKPVNSGVSPGIHSKLNTPVQSIRGVFNGNNDDKPEDTSSGPSHISTHGGSVSILSHMSGVPHALSAKPKVRLSIIISFYYCSALK